MGSERTRAEIQAEMEQIQNDLKTHREGFEAQAKMFQQYLKQAGEKLRELTDEFNSATS